MDKIASFTVNHNTLKPGMYLSRIDGGDIVTYDLRTRLPNSGDYMDNAAIHTLEHLFATFARNSKWKDHVVYFGPMGCRTGFYFILQSVSEQDAIDLTKNIIGQIAEYHGEIPGQSAVECGNYLEHDLAGAVKEAGKYRQVLQNWTVNDLQYK